MIFLPLVWPYCNISDKFIYSQMKQFIPEHVSRTYIQVTKENKKVQYTIYPKPKYCLMNIYPASCMYIHTVYLIF